MGTSRGRHRLRNGTRGVGRGSLICTTWISPSITPRGVAIGREKGVTLGGELTGFGASKMGGSRVVLIWDEAGKYLGSLSYNGRFWAGE